MKQFYGSMVVLAALVIMFLIGVVPAFATDVWTAATTEVTTAATSVTSLLMAAVAIPLAFLGYHVVKKVVAGAR